MATCFQNTQFNKSKLLCTSLYHQRHSWQNSTPHPPHMEPHWCSLGLPHTNWRSEKMFYCTGCLSKSLGGIEEAKPSMPSSHAASLLMCSFATTKPGRLRKARMGVTSSLWIHWDDPSSFPLLRQSFAVGSLDPSLDASGWDRHRQAEGRAVAQGKARATAQMAAENPTLSLSPSAGNARTAPITADQRPPQAALSGGWKWSEDPWPSAWWGYTHHPCLAWQKLSAERRERRGTRLCSLGVALLCSDKNFRL